MLGVVQVALGKRLVQLRQALLCERQHTKRRHRRQHDAGKNTQQDDYGQQPIEMIHIDPHYT
ncbi:MAG: hypothetical protein HZY76_19340 [Anaerolineae bacterium]|nr:MAG: hypothetical protein HZY76_19340 [Anaerolineae bacterium]